MKKFIAVLVSLCVVAMAAAVTAGAATWNMSKENRSQLLELGSALLGMDSEEIEDLYNDFEDGMSNKQLKSLAVSMLGGSSYDGEKLAKTLAADENVVSADSVDAFYGTWRLNRAVANGVPVSLKMLSGLNLDVSAKLNFSAKGVTVSGSMNGDSRKLSTNRKLNKELTDDGVLIVNVKGIPAALALTESGELICSTNMGDIYFVKA